MCSSLVSDVGSGDTWIDLSELWKLQDQHAS